MSRAVAKSAYNINILSESEVYVKLNRTLQNLFFTMHNILKGLNNNYWIATFMKTLVLLTVIHNIFLCC